MKKLITLILTLAALQGMAQRFYLSDGQTITYKRNYAGIDLTQPVPGLASNLQWYVEVRDSKPSYDNRTHKLNMIKTASTTASEYGSHILEYQFTYTVIEKDSLSMVESIQNESANYLSESFTQEYIQSLQSEGGILNNIKASDIAYTAEQQARETYIESVYVFYATVRAEATAMITAYATSGTLPSFNFTSKPVEP